MTQLKENKITPENFSYWLQGYFEINGTSNELTPMQVQIIKDHLDLVFKKETPQRSPFPTKQCNHELGKNCGCFVEYRDGIDPMFSNMVASPPYGQVVYNQHAVTC